MTKKAVLLVASGSLPIDPATVSQASEYAQVSGAELHCLYVYDELKWSSKLSRLLPDIDTVRDTLAEKATQALSAQVQAISGVEVKNYSVSFGHLFLEAIRYCQRYSITMMVKAAKKPGWARMFFDSEDLHLLRKSSVPVWLTVPGNEGTIKSVAVALDFDHDEEPESRSLNKQLLLQAIRIAKLKKVPLHLINVFNIHDLDFATLWADDPNKLEKTLLADEKVTRQAAMQRIIHEVDKENPEAFNALKHTVHLINGSPSEMIANTVNRLPSPLLVMGSVGRSGVSGLFIGNTAESTLFQVQCPIVVMKPEGFISPVNL